MEMERLVRSESSVRLEQQMEMEHRKLKLFQPRLQSSVRKDLQR